MCQSGTEGEIKLRFDVTLTNPIANRSRRNDARKSEGWAKAEVQLTVSDANKNHQRQSSLVASSAVVCFLHSASTSYQSARP